MQGGYASEILCLHLFGALITMTVNIGHMTYYIGRISLKGEHGYVGSYSGIT
jgi:hypothetical protein